MKRREYCALSKGASQYVPLTFSQDSFWGVLFRYVLEQILSGEATETVIEYIHEYLTTIGENVREGKIKMDEFIIFKVTNSFVNSNRYWPMWFCSAWGKIRKITQMLRANLMYKLP
jgi:hypothetical protein